MNASERQNTLDALIAMMYLVRGGKRANAGEIIAAAIPEHIVSMASAHKLMPSIAAAFELAQVKDVVDPELTEFFQFIRNENAARNHILLKQLYKLAMGFESRGLKPPVALKGVVFLLESPENLSDRFMRDIDLLVAPNEFDAVIDAMKEMNYLPMEGIDFNLQTDLHYPAFIHPDYDGTVEVHFRLSQSGGINWLDWNGLISRSSLLQLQEGTIYLPDNEWRLAHLVYHSQINGHYFNRRVIALRDCLDYFDLVTKPDVDLASVRNGFVEIGAHKEFDGIAALSKSVFDGLLPAESITNGGKNWGNQSKSALVHNHNRTFWLVVDWARMFTNRLLSINSWKAAFQLAGNKEHLRMRMNHWWNQFKNGLGPHG